MQICTLTQIHNQIQKIMKKYNQGSNQLSQVHLKLAMKLRCMWEWKLCYVCIGISHSEATQEQYLHWHEYTDDQRTPQIPCKYNNQKHPKMNNIHLKYTHFSKFNKYSKAAISVTVKLHFRYIHTSHSKQCSHTSWLHNNANCHGSVIIYRVISLLQVTTMSPRQRS